MNRFSKQTVECLNRAGWHPDARRNPIDFEQSLKTAGFIVHEAALSFLRTYGGLHILYPHAKVKNMQDEMHFDPSIVVNHVQPADIQFYGDVVGQRLCPIGEASRGYLVLMMDEHSRVYGSYDDFFVKVGCSGDDAIEALCSGRRMEVIAIANDCQTTPEH